MRVYLLLGHPDSDSFNGALADAYAGAAEAAGHQLRRHNLGELRFDPVLWKGYKQIQELEPDLKAVQENLTWCERFVLFYPMWWGGVPAPLKGLFDRAFLPGFGFHAHDDDMLWDPLLTGREAQVFATSDSPAIWSLLAYRNSDFAQVRAATLRFCGLKPVRCRRLGGMKGAKPERLQAHLAQVRAAAAR